MCTDFQYFYLISGMLTVLLVWWQYFWCVDHISGLLTIVLVCWPYFWSVDHIWYVDRISGTLTIFLVYWTYFWYVDLKSGVGIGFSFKGFHCQLVLNWVRHAKCTWYGCSYQVYSKEEETNFTVRFLLTIYIWLLQNCYWTLKFFIS